MPEALAREAKLAVFDIVNRKISVGVLSPQNPKTIETVESLKSKGFAPTLYMISTSSLERAWSRYKEISFASEVKAGVLDISNEEIQKFISETRTINDAKNLIGGVLKMKKGFRISRILEIILAGGLSMNSSDIHIEPEESYARLRYRLDGLLTDILDFDLETFALLLSRIKLISGLKLNVKESAQDGRFSIQINTTNIDIRTSILPHLSIIF